MKRLKHPLQNDSHIFPTLLTIKGYTNNLE